MHLGVDVTWLPRDRRGMGRFVSSLLGEMLDAPDDLGFTLLSRESGDRDAIGQVLGSRAHAWRFCPWSQVKTLEADVCWFPWNRIDIAPDCPRVVTIHDTAAFDWPKPGVLAWLDNHRAQQQLRRAVARAQRVMTVSTFSRDCIRRHLGVPPERVDIVCEGESFSARLATAPPLAPAPGERPFVLFVGAPDRRKNLEGLLQAWAVLQERSALEGYELLVAGTDESAGRKLCGALPGVRFETEVDDDRLLRLYRTCRLFVMPSHYEGFGLPLLEALACGAPVAAARAASLPEVGGDVPEWFDPRDPDDIARAVAQVLDDPSRAEQMRDLGPRQARKFTWQRAAAQVLACLRHARVESLPPGADVDPTEPIGSEPSRP